MKAPFAPTQAQRIVPGEMRWCRFDRQCESSGDPAPVHGSSEYRFLFSVTFLQTQRTTLQQLNDI
jgi:hypothetical protein